MNPKYRVPFIQTGKQAVAQIIKYPDVGLLGKFLMVFGGRCILFDVWKCICLRTWQPSHSQRWSSHFSSHCCSVFSDIFGWFSKLPKHLQKKSIDVYLWRRHTSPSLCTDSETLTCSDAALTLEPSCSPLWSTIIFVCLHGSNIKIILNYGLYLYFTWS